MLKQKKIVSIVLDVVELYVPIAAFSILFLTFIWSVFTRYVLKQPCGWAADVEIGCYIWVVLLSASYVTRLDKHVRFNIVYELLGKRAQIWVRIFSNIFIIIPFALLIWPTFRYLLDLKTISTSLQLPLKFYYAPILWFIGSTLLYSLRALIGDLRLLVSKKQGEGDKA